MNPRILVFGAALALAAGALAIEFEPFGPAGQGGSRNRQEFKIGAGASVYEYDAFVAIAGQDLNGDLAGTAAQLSRHPLPAGLKCVFSTTLSEDKADLVVTYTLTNGTGADLGEVRLLVFLDAEMTQETNTFFNEYGVVQGAVGRGSWDTAADLYQIDEPGFAGGTLYRRFLAGTLDNTNAVPQESLNDVALGLGFMLGPLKAGDTMPVQVLISEVNHTLGSLALVHRDAQLEEAITFSGQAGVTELPFFDVTGQLQLSFTWTLHRPSGALAGTLTIASAATNTVTFAAPFQLGLPTSTNFWLARPAGTIQGTIPYVDLSSQIPSPLVPGSSVVVTDIRVLSRDRSPPPLELFRLWATELR